jgi:hypothetical protein
LMLLKEAGLINAMDVSSNDELCLLPLNITWNGYEFLDAARDDTRWKQAKDVISKMGGLAFEVLKAYLVKLMTENIGL